MQHTRFTSYFNALTLLSVLLLASCASLESDRRETITPGITAEPAAQPALFEEWVITTRSLGNSGTQVEATAAVMQLASQADAYIAKSSWQQASDSLERLVRIAPDYAPAWSRMAWLSMTTGDFDRARQMAARSNSYASGRVDLKLLNWGLIRDASLQLKDVSAVQRAERNLEALGNL